MLQSFPKKCGNMANGKPLGNDNTMCRYTSMRSPCNRKICQYGPTEAQKKYIVDEHNKLRRKVAKGQETRGGQPSAANMNKLVWSDELAEVAQRWVDQCPGASGSMHDRNRKSYNFPCNGQNFAMMGSFKDAEGDEVKTMIYMWYDEVKDFNRNKINPFNMYSGHRGVVGHYTSMCWATVRYIGCGYIKYDAGRFNNEILVCTYGQTPSASCNQQPNMHMDGTSMYIEGAAGSKCEKNDDGLCDCVKGSDGYCK